MARSKPRRAVIVVLLIAVVSAGAYFFNRQNAESQQNALTLYGNVDIRQVQLAFENAGRIERIHVTEGARVAPGELVAQIENTRYHAAVMQAKARVASQEQTVARLLAGSRPEEIAAAKARVEVAEANLEDARQKYERTKKLAETKFVPEQQLDSARTALDGAFSNVEAEKQALELAVKGPRKEDIAAAQAQLDAYRAALDLAEEDMADTKLYAPSAGVIRDRILEVGDMASPQKPVLTLALTSPLWVRAYVDEPNLAKIAPGMTAAVSTDSFPGKMYEGWIGYISPTAEFTPRSVQTEELRSKLVYQVRIYVCNPENELRLGMPATVKVPLDQPRGTNIPPGGPCAEQ